MMNPHTLKTSRFKVPGKDDLLFFILSTRMLPAVVVTRPACWSDAPAKSTAPAASPYRARKRGEGASRL